MWIGYIKHYHQTHVYVNGTFMLIMKTSSNENVFWGETTGHRWIPSQRPVTRSFDVFFELHLNKRLSKQTRQTPVIWNAIALIMTSL